MSGRGGSGSFGSGRTAGYAAIGEAGHHPGWKPLQGSANDHVPGWAPSPCRLPGPVTRYETCLRRVLTAATVSSTPFRAPEKVCGARCAGEFSGQVLGVPFLVLGSWVCLVLGCHSSFLVFRGGLVPSDLGVRTTRRARWLSVYGTIERYRLQDS